VKSTAKQLATYMKQLVSVVKGIDQLMAKPEQDLTAAERQTLERLLQREQALAPLVTKLLRTENLLLQKRGESLASRGDKGGWHSS
jgi:hypothetical protein